MIENQTNVSYIAILQVFRHQLSFTSIVDEQHEESSMPFVKL